MKYLVYYNHRKDDTYGRAHSPAAETKLSYIAKCIADFAEVEIISASGVVGAKSDHAKKETIANNISVRYFFSLGRKNYFIGKIGTLILHIQLFCYLLFGVKNSETILVYHSLGYMRLVGLAKMLKNFKVILEVEEIYGDVICQSSIKNRELNFFRRADGFVFPTKLLSHIINTDGKPEVIIHGTYEVEPDRKTNIFRKNDMVEVDRIIHCVYAGTLDPRKGGTVAASAAEFLPANYHVHILGFGSEQDKQELINVISDVSKKTQAKVSYDGLLSGEEYINFIQSCDIGLSPQNPGASFNGTSFPSKILSYLSNGLQVVSIRIPSIECSAVGRYLYFFDNQTPEEVAKTIVSVDMESTDEVRDRIVELDHKFRRELQKMLSESDINIRGISC